MLLTIILITTAWNIRAQQTEPLLKWSFNEGQGNIFVNDAGIYGQGKIYGNVKWREGASGQENDFALQFDGENGYAKVECLTPDGKNLNLQKMTVEFQVRFEKLPKEKDICIISDLSLNFRIGMRAKKKESWFFLGWKDEKSGDSFVIASGYSHRNLKEGVWHHIAATFDGSHVKFYIDGKLSIAPSCWVVRKGKKQGRGVKFSSEEGFPFSGNIQLSGLSFGTEIRGNLKRHKAKCAIDNAAVYPEALKSNELDISGENTMQKKKRNFIPTIEL